MRILVTFKPDWMRARAAVIAHFLDELNETKALGFGEFSFKYRCDFDTSIRPIARTTYGPIYAVCSLLRELSCACALMPLHHIFLESL
jgi:hypothetical protein